MPSPSPSASSLRRWSLCWRRPSRSRVLLAAAAYDGGQAVRSRAHVAWPVSLAPRGKARDGNTGSAPGVAPFAGLIPGADGSGVRRPLCVGAVHPIGPTCRWRARRPGRFHRGTVGRVRWMLEGGGRPAFPWPDDGRGRVSLGSWALPPRPVRAAGRFAVPRRAADPVLGLVLSQVLGRRMSPRRSLPNDRGIRRRARTGCESVPATSPRDRSRPRSARGLHDGWQYMTRGKAIARGVAAGRESRAIGAGPSIPPALRRLQNWCLADPASDQNPAPGRLPV
jgi:hypothetical protein